MAGRVVNCTWIMTWISDKQSWWESDKHCGSKLRMKDGWYAHSWNNEAHVDYLLREIKKAGIDIIISDLTNGDNGLLESINIQKKCKELELGFCVAFNHHGSKEYFEEQAQRILDMFAGDKAENKEAYAYKDGKPLIITYVTREWLEAINNCGSKYLDIFQIEWASGEDSEVNKWGWQLEPAVGPISSKESMFITPSIKWAINDEVWRKSLSWLDYTFYKAYKNNAKYRIIGSFDDIQERNCWYIADTSLCLNPCKMKDIYGKVSVDAYYNRVCQWINGKPESIQGGIIADGVYRLRSIAQDKLLNTIDNSAYEYSKLCLNLAYAGINYNFCFYHLGDNIYRIIKLNSGLSLCDNGENAIQVSDDDCDNQKWKLVLDGEAYLFENIETKRYLSVNNLDVVMVKQPDENSKWNLEEVIVYNKKF